MQKYTEDELTFIDLLADLLAEFEVEIKDDCSTVRFAKNNTIFLTLEDILNYFNGVDNVE